MIGTHRHRPERALPRAAPCWRCCLFIERRTVLGRALKAVGAGEPGGGGLRASTSSATRCWPLRSPARLAAIAGLLFSVKLSGGAPSIANGFLLPAIVAVLVGGTPLTGGVGGVLNTLIGTLIVAVIRASMLYLGVAGDAAADVVRPRADRGHRADHRPLQAAHGQIDGGDHGQRCRQRFSSRRAVSSCARFRCLRSARMTC